MLNLKYEYIQRFIPSGSLILDVGCGEGEFLSLLKNKYKVVGIDLKKSGKRGFEYIVMDAHCLAFKNSVFDAVILSDMLEHAENPFEIIKEVGRILKDNGIVFFSTVNKNPFLYPLLKILDLVYSRKNWLPHRYSQLLSPSKLHRMFSEINMKKLDMNGVIVGVRRARTINRVGLYYIGVYKKYRC